MPLSLSAGAEMIELKPASVKLLYNSRMLIMAHPSSLLCTMLMAFAASGSDATKRDDSSMLIVPWLDAGMIW